MSAKINPEVEDKRKKLEELKQFHMETLAELGVSTTNFIAKLAYTPTGKTETIIALFESEVSRGTDLYIEFAHRDNLPLDLKHRTLYKYIFNPHYAEEYENVGSGAIRYLIPVSELIVVKKYNEEEEIEEEIKIPQLKKEASKEFELPDSNTDLPIDQLTIRDLVAILKDKPVSYKPWLNDLITKKKVK